MVGGMGYGEGLKLAVWGRKETQKNKAPTARNELLRFRLDIYKSDKTNSAQPSPSPPGHFWPLGTGLPMSRQISVNARSCGLGSLLCWSEQRQSWNQERGFELHNAIHDTGTGPQRPSHTCDMAPVRAPLGRHTVDQGSNISKKLFFLSNQSRARDERKRKYTARKRNQGITLIVGYGGRT